MYHRIKKTTEKGKEGQHDNRTIKDKRIYE